MPEHEMAPSALEAGRRMFLGNVRGVSLEEAVDAAGALRSVFRADEHVARIEAEMRAAARQRTEAQPDGPARGTQGAELRAGPFDSSVTGPSACVGPIRRAYARGEEPVLARGDAA
jgi:hypothetical protein